MWLTCPQHYITLHHVLSLNYNTVLLEILRELHKKLDAGHSTECITHAGHSIAFLHFVTLWPWPLTSGPNLLISRRRIVMAILVSAVRFGFFVRTDRQTHRERESLTDADDRYTHVEWLKWPGQAGNSGDEDIQGTETKMSRGRRRPGVWRIWHILSTKEHHTRSRLDQQKPRTSITPTRQIELTI